ncbi:unnamed protein product [Symbiodinium necroappetens]|uniref:Uncharacterized protein n=1 Tax=Symbiodinium necroappetens TaxID=1628268 RepID=A0A812L9S0_9DINO|nr:unnamed protein product [Symbiodinium necroappetens]
MEMLPSSVRSCATMLGSGWSAPFGSPSLAWWKPSSAAIRDYLDASLFLLLRWLPSAGSWTSGKSTTLPALSSAARLNLLHL